MTMYLFEVYIPDRGREKVGLKPLGWMYARYREMPLVPLCYGIFGMRQVVVFGLSMEVLR